MKLAEMHAKAAAELEHIPDWPGEHQKELRAMYKMLRMHSLGRDATKKGQTAPDVLRDSIEFVKKDHPDAVLHYDRKLFAPGEA